MEIEIKYIIQCLNAQESKSRRKMCKSNKVRTFMLKPTTVMKQR